MGQKTHGHHHHWEVDTQCWHSVRQTQTPTHDDTIQAPRKCREVVTLPQEFTEDLNVDWGGLFL